MAEGRDGVWSELVARAGRPGTTVVSGPLGIGRSTMLRRLADETGATLVAGLGLLSDLRLLVCSRIVRADLAEASVEDAVEEVAAALAGPLVVDDAQDLDGDSVRVLLAVGRTRPVVLGWRTGTAGVPSGDDVVDVRLPPLEAAAAGALARSAGVADPGEVVHRSGANPGLLLALAGRGDRGRHEASVGAAVDGLPDAARTSLALLACAATPVPGSLVEGVDELVDHGFAEFRDGAVRGVHGLAGELAWNTLEGDEQRSVRRRLVDELDDPVAVADQLVALGDTAAAVDHARRAAPVAAPGARARLTSFVAERTGDPDDHALAAEAAVRFTDGTAALRHAAAAGGRPDACLRTAQGLRLQGDVAAARTAAASCGDPDGDRSEELAAEVALLTARAEGRPLPIAASSDAARAAEERGDLDAAVTAHVGSLVDDLATAAQPDPLGTTGALLALGERTGAPVIRHQHESLAIAGFHAGTVGTDLADVLDGATGPVLRLHRAVALALAGRTGDASTLVDEGPWPDTPVWRSARWWARAEIALLAGRLVTCAAAAGEAAAEVPATFPAVDLAALAACRAAVESGAQPADLRATSVIGRAVEAEAAALASLAAGDEGAADLFTEAASAWAGRHHPADLRCRAAAAELRLPAPAAVNELEAVVEEAERLGLRVLVARSRRQLHRAGVRRRSDGSGAGAGALSPRERQVLELVGGGASSREIANQLGVAPSTVDTQVKSAMQKLGARTRLQAAAMLGTMA